MAVLAEPHAPGLEGVLLSFGLLLACGSLAGWLARQVRLPALTGYLAAGILLARAPALAGHPDPPWNEHFGLAIQAVTDFAMALVLFVLGGSFEWSRVAPRARSLLILAAVESVATFTLVTALTAPLAGDLRAAVLLGILAIAVAPATTLLVLREYGSRGPLTETLTAATTLSNLVAIFAFEVALLILVALGGAAEVSAWPILWDLFGSLLYGLLAGHALILFQERIGGRSYALPLATVLLLTIGICDATDVPHMLAFLVTGAVVSNRSRLFAPITEAMDTFAQPAYVAFFVLSGWHLQFDVFAENAGVIALYVLGRSLGKILGCRLGLGLARVRIPGSPRLGWGLLCQAGAAIALANIVSARYDPDLGSRLLSIILGAVVAFELLGPLLVRRVVVQAGEVPVTRLLSGTPLEEHHASWFATFGRVLRGRRPRAGDAGSWTVDRIKRPAEVRLSRRDDLDAILRKANHAPYNTLPVVDDEDRLVGVIRLQDLDAVTYDPQLAHLVSAEDLAALNPEEASVPAGAGLQEAAAFFARSSLNTAPVVDGEENRRLTGMVERGEVLALMRQLGLGVPGPESSGPR